MAASRASRTSGSSASSASQPRAALVGERGIVQHLQSLDVRASAPLLLRTGLREIAEVRAAEFADALEPALERQRRGVLLREESARLRAVAEIAVQKVERGSGVVQLRSDHGFDAGADLRIGLFTARGEEIVEEIERIVRGNEAPVGVAHESAVRAGPGERSGQWWKFGDHRRIAQCGRRGDPRGPCGHGHPRSWPSSTLVPWPRRYSARLPRRA
jgi:hypothetical protein